MEAKEKYITLVLEIIAKQSIILGEEMAHLKARNVSEFILDENGKIVDIKGDPHVALQKLIDEYVALSGQIVKNVLGPIFSKYPDIKL